MTSHGISILRVISFKVEMKSIKTYSTYLQGGKFYENIN